MITNNLSNVTYTVVRPRYFAPFYNFKSLLLNTYPEGTLSSKSAVVKAVSDIESKMMGERRLYNGVNTTNRVPVIAELLNKCVRCVPKIDGRYITILPEPSLFGQPNYGVTIKSNRTTVTTFQVPTSFTIDIGSKALAYANEKYSLGVTDCNNTCGFALVVDEGEAGVKGSMDMRVIYFNKFEYIVDSASKYIDVSPYC